VSITALTCHPVRLPLASPFVTAQRSTEHVEAVLVRALDDQGVAGWGEAVTTWRVTGESAASVAAAVDGPLRDAVLGVDPADVAAWAPTLDHALVGNAAARSAVASALLDAAARRSDVPLAELLAGTGRDRPGRPVAAVQTDMTLSAVRSPAELDALLARAVAWARVFRTLKVKVVDAPVTRDVLVELRRTVGPDVRLRVDANQAWDAAAAVEVLEHWQEHGADVELVEQPVAAFDLPALAAVRATGLTAVLADEAVHTVADVDAVARYDAADGVNVKLTKSGGPVQALLLADRARGHGIDVIVGCMMESTVGLAAAAAVAAVLDARGGAGVHDLDAGMWLATRDEDRVRYDGDMLVRSDEAGIGRPPQEAVA
jgi:L-alanine-DL-glutamate epimerase-like enolase superfamily enzyme